MYLFKVYSIEAKKMPDEETWESGSPGGPAQPTGGAEVVCGALLSQRSKHTPEATRCSSSALVSLFLMRNPALHSLLPLHHHHSANNNCLLMMHISHICTAR